MSTRVADRVDDWNQRQFSGGHGGLADLAAEEFSGVVRAGGAELYMTAGTVVAIRRGSMEDFADGSGTAFEAPDPSMPLLAAMQAEDVDPRAEYYSEETPISEVDRTLSDGGFTGYIELSENVLSGDYFVVYHGGTSSSVAFVGASEQLVTGDEAFETADDEVGIYYVHQVDVEPIEIPASATAAAGGGSAGGAEEADSASQADSASGADESTEEGEDPAATVSEETEASEDDDSTGGSTEADETEADEPEHAEGDAAATAVESEPGDSSDADAPGESGTATSSEGGSSTATGEESRSTTGTDRAGGGGGAGANAGGTATGTQAGTGSGATGQATTERSHGTGTAGGATAGSSGQAGDLETRGVPSLDPDLTQYPQRSTGGGSASSGGAPAEAREAPPGGQAAQGAAGGAAQQPGGHRSPGGSGGRPAEAAPEAAGTRSAETAGGELADLEDELVAREAELEELEAELEMARSEREETEAELEAVREERDELEAEAARLREELGRLEEELGAATDAEQRMTPTEAIEGTNLFVDYESKGQGTLEKAHGGSETRDDVNENLQVGVHTEFEEHSVAVGGQDFGEFLRGTLQYRFAEWLLGQLLFEIRDTGHAEALNDLYDAIPEIRRVEFNGEIDVEYVEDGQEKVATERFDVIFRHRMGDPLVVANLNDARDPASGSMMTSLVTAAERVGQTEDSLAAAFLVTSSFFESEALETVSEATKGGILSRDKRTSFVNLSRKSGYHLCLVAAREGNFHMEVPEL